jgi:hypothetical protein
MNENNQKSQIHSNYKKAADMIYLSGAFGIGNLIWKSDTLDSGLKIFIAVISVGFLFVLGYFISKGIDWLKFFLAVILFFGIVGIPFLLRNFTDDLVLGIVNIVQTILQIWAVILLFKIPKEQ